MKKIIMSFVSFFILFSGSILFYNNSYAVTKDLEKMQLGDVDMECMIDLMNDRFGVSAGSVLGFLENVLGGTGSDADYKKIENYTERAGKYSTSIGKWEGEGMVMSADGKSASWGSALGDMDMNNLNLNDLVGIIDPEGKTVFAGSGIKRGARIVRCNIDKGVSTGENLIDLIIGWTNFVLSIAAVLAVVALVWAGITYITSLGDDGRKENAKNTIIYTVIGIILIFGAYAVVNTIIKGSIAVVS